MSEICLPTIREWARVEIEELAMSDDDVLRVLTGLFEGSLFEKIAEIEKGRPLRQAPCPRHPQTAACCPKRDRLARLLHNGS